MKINNVCVKEVNEGRILAEISLTLDHAIAVHGIKIIRGNNDKLFAAMPSKADCKGIFRDVAHPVNTAFRRQIETCLLDEYEKFLARKMNFSE